MKKIDGSELNQGNNEPRHNEEAERKGYEEIAELARRNNPVAIEVLGRALLNHKQCGGLSDQEVLQLLATALRCGHSQAWSLLELAANRTGSAEEYDQVLSEYIRLGATDPLCIVRGTLDVVCQGQHDGALELLQSLSRTSWEASIVTDFMMLAEKRYQQASQQHELLLQKVKEGYLAIGKTWDEEHTSLTASLSKCQHALSEAKQSIADLQATALHNSNAALRSSEAALRHVLTQEREAHAAAIAGKDRELADAKKRFAVLEGSIPGLIEDHHRILLKRTEVSEAAAVKAERKAERSSRKCERYETLCRAHGLALYGQLELAETGGAA